MDIGRSIRFVFEDKDWISKLLVGLLISIVPILNFAFFGYLIRLLRNVREGILFPLPDWSDIGDYFVKGLIVFVVAIIYLIPVILIGLIFGGVGAITDIATEGNVTEAASGFFAGAGILFSCLTILYSLAFAFYYYAMMIHFSKHGTFGSCFEIREIIKIISDNLSEYLTAWVIAILFGIVLGIVGTIAFTILFFIPCIGWIVALVLGAFLAVWPNVVIFHMFGQVGTTQMETVA